jgi:dephospho-CoA kinase
MTKIIGLTGGIGSGKLHCSKSFSIFGNPVYIADEARKIMQTPDVIDAIKETFGTTLLKVLF